MEGGAEHHDKPNPLMRILHFINSQIASLNSSKFFAGFMIILINICAKFITIQFSKSTEEYLKYVVSKQLLIFAMAWMGLRDIYAALGMTAILTILTDHLFNEDSALCVIPPKYRVTPRLRAVEQQQQGQGTVSDAEINAAIATLDRAKREKEQLNQRDIFSRYFSLF